MRNSLLEDLHTLICEEGTLTMESTGQQLVKPAAIDMLKPWIKGEFTKSNESRVKMLQSRSLVDLYKCMGTRCSFTTNESGLMVNHLYTHGSKHDSLVCAYCSYCETKNPESLVKHIEDVHTVGKYQCRFCFYRAFDAGNVVHHQYWHHKGSSNMKHTIITLYENKTLPNIDFTSEATSASSKKRNYLECCVCHSTHVSISLFAAHVRMHGDSTTECPVCLATVDIRMIQVHLINHRLDHFECLYCTTVYSRQQDMQHHLCDVHYLRALICCMKMKRYQTLYDIYIVENLSIDVPADRLIDCNTVLNRLPYGTGADAESLNVISPSKEIQPIELPKILKVLGGIQMTKNLLKAAVPCVPKKVVSIDTIEGSGCATAAQTVSEDLKNIKAQGEIQMTEELLNASGYNEPKKVASIDTAQGSGCATVAQTVSEDSKILKVQREIQMTEELLNATVSSGPKKVFSVDTAEGSGCATAAQKVSKDGNIVKVQGGIQLEKNLLKAAVSNVPKKVASFDTAQGAGCATAEQTVSEDLKIVTVQGGIQMSEELLNAAVYSVPKKVSSVDTAQGSRCATAAHKVSKDGKIVKVQEGIQLKKNLFKAAVSRVAKKVASIDTIASSGCASAAQTVSTEPLPSTSKAICNSVRVKSFAFIKTTLSACDDNQTLPRKRVKLTKLGDGSIIMDVPSALLLNGKIRRKTSTVIGGNEQRVITPLEGASTIQTDKVGAKNCNLPDRASRVNNPRFVKPTLETRKLQKNEQSTNITNMDDEKDNDQDRRSEVTCNNIHSASSKESQHKIRNIRCYLSAYGRKLDHYYKSLEALVSRHKFTGRDVFVCGTNGCTACFPESANLIAHMRGSCQNGVGICCKHCYLKSFTIDSYIRHLNIHRLEKFACFLCTHSHFLLRNIVEHMKDVHKCNALRISFAHPQKVNILQDIIVVIPVDLSDVNIEKHIDRVILEGTKNHLVEFSLPKQVVSRVLYTCGFCQQILPSKLSLERHILLCIEQNNNYYPCAHCTCRFTDWIDKLSNISQHLYFHGERLYKCSSCPYHHFQRSNVVDHITQFCRNAGSTVGIVRESRVIWKCNICSYRSLFKQGVMEHMENTHNLPGEQYMCALCDSRLSTIGEMKMHCQKQHYDENVSMVEMYQPLGKINEEIYGMRGKKVVGPIDNITIVKANQFNSEEITKQDEITTGLQSVLEVIPDGTSQYIDDANDNKLAITLLKSILDLQDEDQQTFDNERSGVAPGSRVQINTDQNRDKCLSSLQAARLDCRLDDTQQPVGHSKDSSSSISSKPNKNSPVECIISANPRLNKPASQGPCLSTSADRRISRRVAVKSNNYTRFHESFKYLCHSCKMCFKTFAELEIHSETLNDEGSGKMCPCAENYRAFCLMALVRCFYCNEQDTCEALRQHCLDKHSTKQFVCIDFWDSFKCGLCLYRNGSGSEKDFWQHFKNFHAQFCNKYTYYGYIDQSFLDWALKLGRNDLPSGIQPEVKAIRYVCNHCNESDTSEVSIGSHVARHWLKFNCVKCQKDFKYLKHLYYHAIAIHRMDDLQIDHTFSSEYDEHLLDVLIVYENGLMLSIRQLQHTTIATLEYLKSGFQSYYSEQVQSMDSYKETLLMPIFTSSESRAGTTETCKGFIQNQTLHLGIELERVSDDYFEGKEK